MTWKANVTDSPAHFGVDVILAAIFDGYMLVPIAVEENGDLTMEEARLGSDVRPVLRLPREAADALRDALNGHAPPSSDADVREALKVERARVDRILGLLSDQEHTEEPS